MAEQFKVWKGKEANLPATGTPGHLYHCTDTKNTYLVDSSNKMQLFSNAVFAPSHTLSGPLTVTGGDAATAGKIILNQNQLGQITDAGTSTLFGFTSATLLTIGHTSYGIKLRGDGIPAYNNDSYIATFSSSTSNRLVKFTNKHTLANSNITDDNSTITLLTKVVLQGNGSSYNEGLRILPASNGWSNIFFSANSSVSGEHNGGWLIGRRGAAGSISGAVGDFTIEENSSNGANFTIHQNGGGATLQGPLTLNNHAKMTYDSTNECLNFTFV